MGKLLRFLILAVLIVLFLGAVHAFTQGQLVPGSGVYSAARDARVVDWLQNPSSHLDWSIQAQQQCPGAPFLLPTDGYIGYLWDDGFKPGHRHQGLDIFGGTQPGETPVYAAYDGYITRESGWVSSLIERVPQDPLQPGRQIWLYYTHMADPTGSSIIEADFPPGTSELFVKAGTLLGYQGNYSGTPGSPVGVHLHFSIVKDNGQSHYLNELDIENTLDPSPYLGIHVNARENPPDIPLYNED